MNDDETRVDGCEFKMSEEVQLGKRVICRCVVENFPKSTAVTPLVSEGP